MRRQITIVECDICQTRICDTELFGTNRATIEKVTFKVETTGEDDLNDFCQTCSRALVDTINDLMPSGEHL